MESKPKSSISQRKLTSQSSNLEREHVSCAEVITTIPSINTASRIADSAMIETRP
jgi:hypothetical protein